MVGFHPAFPRHVRADASIWLRKSWILPARKLQLFRIIFVLFLGHAATMPDRNNYANNDVGILYRLYLMYLMYVHNYSAQKRR